MNNLENVLAEYHKYLILRKLVKEEQAPYLVRWVREFLQFARDPSTRFACSGSTTPSTALRASRAVRNHAKPQAEAVPISIDKTGEIANRKRFSEILLVETGNLLRAHNSWNILAWQALHMYNFSLTKNLFGGVLVFAPQLTVCMYTEGEDTVVFGSFLA